MPLHLSEWCNLFGLFSHIVRSTISLFLSFFTGCIASHDFFSFVFMLCAFFSAVYSVICQHALRISSLRLFWLINLPQDGSFTNQERRKVLQIRKGGKFYKSEQRGICNKSSTIQMAHGKWNYYCHIYDHSSIQVETTTGLCLITHTITPPREEGDILLTTTIQGKISIVKKIFLKITKFYIKIINLFMKWTIYYLNFYWTHNISCYFGRGQAPQ